MSKGEVTREEMLEWMDILGMTWPSVKDDGFAAICDLIEQSGEPEVMTRVSGTPIKPKVSREFVEKWKDRIVTVEIIGRPANSSTVENEREIRAIDHIEEMLTELGHEVEK